jgi:O-antigen/teichoic acid export membrane protein
MNGPAAGHDDPSPHAANVAPSVDADFPSATRSATAGVAGPRPGNLGWSVFRNTAAQLVGRNLIALSRLFLSGIVVRRFGKETFGEYSLVLVLLFIAEWLLDFGSTDMYVREICREPWRRLRLLRIMTASKAVQLPVAGAVLCILLLALRYPARIVEAGLVGGIGMLFYAGVLAYRIVFRVDLKIEFEVFAELVSFLTMIPLVILVGHRGGGLVGIFGCYVVSRAVFFGVSMLLGHGRYHLSVRDTAWTDIGWSVRASAAIGAVGFLVVVYETLDVLLLSRLGGLQEVACYSGAQRFVWPVLTSLSAVGGTLYPVAAAYWPNARSNFENAFQRALDSVMILAGAAVCVMLGGAEFLLGLLGPSLVSAAPVLRILGVVCFAKAISTTMGPVLYIVHQEKSALKLVGITLAVKAAVIALVAPRYGCVGVACGTLCADATAAAASVILAQRFTAYRIAWRVPLTIVLVSVGAAIVPRLLISARLPALSVSMALYCCLIFVTGAVHPAELRSLLRWKTS